MVKGRITQRLRRLHQRFWLFVVQDTLSEAGPLLSKNAHMDSRFIDIFRSFKVSLIIIHGHHIKEICLGQTCQMKMVKLGSTKVK